jgi:hypothetical protein
MFEDGIPAWKTKVDFSTRRAAANGGVDPEKAAKKLDHSPERMENATATKV